MYCEQFVTGLTCHAKPFTELLHIYQPEAQSFLVEHFLQCLMLSQEMVLFLHLNLPENKQSSSYWVLYIICKEFLLIIVKTIQLCCLSQRKQNGKELKHNTIKIPVRIGRPGIMIMDRKERGQL